MTGHTSEWTGLECVRKDCDGVGHITVASAYSKQGIEALTDQEE